MTERKIFIKRVDQDVPYFEVLNFINFELFFE